MLEINLHLRHSQLSKMDNFNQTNQTLILTICETPCSDAIKILSPFNFSKLSFLDPTSPIECVCVCVCICVCVYCSVFHDLIHYFYLIIKIQYQMLTLYVIFSTFKFVFHKLKTTPIKASNSAGN